MWPWKKRYCCCRGIRWTTFRTMLQALWRAKIPVHIFLSSYKHARDLQQRSGDDVTWCCKRIWRVTSSDYYYYYYTAAAACYCCYYHCSGRLAVPRRFPTVMREARTRRRRRRRRRHGWPDRSVDTSLPPLHGFNPHAAVRKRDPPRRDRHHAAEKLLARATQPIVLPSTPPPPADTQRPHAVLPPRERRGVIAVTPPTTTRARFGRQRHAHYPRGDIKLYEKSPSIHPLIRPSSLRYACAKYDEKKNIYISPRDIYIYIYIHEYILWKKKTVRFSKMIHAHIIYIWVCAFKWVVYI